AWPFDRPVSLALRVPTMPSALVMAGWPRTIATTGSCPHQHARAGHIADDHWARMPGRATSTGLPRRDQHAGDAAAASDERPGQGCRDPRPPTPDHGPRTAATRRESSVTPTDPA